MLGAARLTAFLASTDLDRARAFYGDVLGLELVSSDEFAAVFDSGGTQVRVTKVGEVAVAPYTVLGWNVDDVDAAIDDLTDRGVEFLRFESMDQDDRGVWTSPGGHRVAWFRDPDGNTLAVAEG